MTTARPPVSPGPMPIRYVAPDPLGGVCPCPEHAAYGLTRTLGRCDCATHLRWCRVCKRCWSHHGDRRCEVEPTRRRRRRRVAP